MCSPENWAVVSLQSHSLWRELAMEENVGVGMEGESGKKGEKGGKKRGEKRGEREREKNY